MLLCTVTEMKGLEVVRGGTGGGAAFLLVVMQVETKKRRIRMKKSFLGNTVE